MRIRERLTFANVASVLALLLVLAGTGTVAHAHGLIGPDKIKDNAVRSWHIKNGQVKAWDIRDGHVRSPDIKNGQVKYHDLGGGLRHHVRDTTNPWDTIPSGRTVTGRFYDRWEAAGTYMLHTVNLPAAAPVALSSSDVIVTGGSGNSTCTGSYANPTAPAGKVCVYKAFGPSASGSTFAAVPHRKHVFYLTFTGLTDGSAYTHYGSWAYTAP